MREIFVIGGGPAGAAAAIAARREGSRVELFEKSKFPRHKVCGEFLSPEMLPVLEQLGIASAFLAERPARIPRLELHFRSRVKSATLPEPAYGLSRYRFDQLLLGQASELGTKVNQCRGEAGTSPVVMAAGRHALTTPAAPRGGRLFGFKAHFQGPQTDAVELYFFHGCYVGVNAIEGGLTNVCGLGPESLFRQFDFDYDAVVTSAPGLSGRLGPMRRAMNWLSVGPLVFENRFHHHLPADFYPAGDALSFVDPFTGSGLLTAVTTGSLAGAAAAQGIPSGEYLSRVRRLFEKPFAMSSLFRGALGTRWAELLAPLLPGQALYRWTRPKAASLLLQ